MTMIRMAICVLAMALPWQALAQGQQAEQGQPGRQESGGKTLSPMDIQVLAKVHHANQMEIDLGRLANQNARSKRVKAFGDLLVKDHGMADKQVLALAKDRGVELPTPQPKDDAEKEKMQKQMAMAEKLKSLSGHEFDRTFTSAMVQGHEQAIQMLEMARGQVEDAKLRSMLGKMIPVLKEHLSIAQKEHLSIAQKLSRNAGATS